MSTDKNSPLTSADMRHIAYAAPTASMERAELLEAERQRERERLASLGDAAEVVLGLERQLAAVDGERRRAAMEARAAKAKLESVHQALSTVLGRNTRAMQPVEFASALSRWKFELTRLAGFIERATNADDLRTMKNVVINMGIKQPSGLAEQAALMGIPERKKA